MGLFFNIKNSEDKILQESMDTIYGKNEIEKCFAMGCCYYNGEGVTQDYRKAEMMFKKAANRGHAKAQYKLGSMYFDGDGVKRDYPKAMKLLTKAADQGDSDALNKLAHMYYIYKSYGATDNSVQEKHKKAAELYQKLADQGDINAQKHLADMYYRGYGVDMDYSKALELYQQLADKGDIESQNKLGDMYYNGYGVTVDYCKAVELYKKSVEQGDADAQYKLSYMYRNGYGVKKSDRKSLELCKKAAEQDHTGALCELGSRYRYGSGVGRNYRKAEELYQRAIDLGDTGAQYSLNSMRDDCAKEKEYRNSALAQSSTNTNSNKAWLDQAEDYLDRGYTDRAVAIIEEEARKGNTEAKDILYKFYKRKNEIEVKRVREETLSLLNELADVVLENAENERQKREEILENVKRDLEIEYYRRKERLAQEKMFTEAKIETQIEKTLERLWL